MSSEPENICQHSLTRLIDLLKTGQLSIADVSKAYASRIKQYANLNAFIETDFTFPSRDLKTPLGGAPLAIKDNIDVAGYPTGAGTPGLAGHTVSIDAPVIARLREYGANFLGKTNLHELSFGITNINEFTGPTRNPHEPTHITGGSSGGSACAVAAGLAPFALGSDTGGSARIPAALCGIFGYRPSHGRYSIEGVVPLSHSRDTIGLLARRLEDIVFVDQLITGDTNPVWGINPKSLRIGVPTLTSLGIVDASTQNAFSSTKTLLDKSGIQLVEFDLGKFIGLNAPLTRPLIANEIEVDMTAYLARRGLDLKPDEIFSKIVGKIEKSMLGSVTSTGKVSKREYKQAIEVHLPALRQAYSDLFADLRVDALLQPTTPLTATPIIDGETVLIGGKDSLALTAFTKLTNPGGNARLASISLPILGHGLPVGMELQCRHGEDIRLFEIAQALVNCLEIKVPIATPHSRGTYG